MFLTTDAQHDIVAAVAPLLEAEVVGYTFFVGLFHFPFLNRFIPAHLDSARFWFWCEFLWAKGQTVYIA